MGLLEKLLAGSSDMCGAHTTGLAVYFSISDALSTLLLVISLLFIVTASLSVLKGMSEDAGRRARRE